MIPVFDAHADSLLEVVDHGRDLPVADYVKGGVQAQVLACWIDPKIPPEQKFPYLEKLIAAGRQQLTTFSSDLILARCGREVEETNRQGKIAILLSLEGADAIDRDSGKTGLAEGEGILGGHAHLEPAQRLGFILLRPPGPRPFRPRPGRPAGDGPAGLHRRPFPCFAKDILRHPGCV